MGLEDLAPKWLTLIDGHLLAVSHHMDSLQGCASSCYGDCWHGFLDLESKWSERVSWKRKWFIKSFGSCASILSHCLDSHARPSELEKEVYKL